MIVCVLERLVGKMRRPASVGRPLQGAPEPQGQFRFQRSTVDRKARAGRTTLCTEESPDGRNQAEMMTLSPLQSSFLKPNDD